MTIGRRRPLTRDERRLWAEVARSVAPLPGRTLPAPPDEPEAAAPSREPAVAPPPGAARPSPVRLKPLAPLDRKVTRDLARGRRAVDASLDLHGHTQADAHAALLHFLARAQRDGHQVVRIVTGKGRPTDGLHAGGRGILRRLVPHWLALPELRTQVLGWTEAGPHQGGAGALHVRLRRRRPA